MNISNYYWHFPAALTPKFCDDVIAYANQKEEVMARTGGYGDRKLKKEEIKDLKRKRNSDLVWLNDTWIYKELHPYVHMANKNAGWNFDYDTPQMIQFTKYEVGGHYTWHRDTNIDISKTGDATRKISITINLNDDYEGGELQIDSEDHYWNKTPRKVRSGLGSIAVFPSDTYHRVTKVTKGTRYSLVVWVMGEPWR